MSWQCNECGSDEYSGSVSTDDIEKLACGRCGANEFHWVEDEHVIRTPEPLIAQLTEALEALRKRQLTDGIPCFCETYYPGRTHNSSCEQARAALAAARKR